MVNEFEVGCHVDDADRVRDGLFDVEVDPGAGIACDGQDLLQRRYLRGVVLGAFPLVVVGRVQGSYLVVRHQCDVPAAVRLRVDGRVVERDVPPVEGLLNIDLDHVDAVCDRVSVRVEGVLRSQLRGTSVSGDRHVLPADIGRSGNLPTRRLRQLIAVERRGLRRRKWEGREYESRDGRCPGLVRRHPRNPSLWELRGSFLRGRARHLPRRLSEPAVQPAVYGRTPVPWAPCAPTLESWSCRRFSG